MTIRQYWVHYDEPMNPEPAATICAAEEPAVSSAAATEPAAEWEKLLSALLQLTQPNAELHRAACLLLAGNPSPGERKSPCVSASVKSPAQCPTLTG
jgi:hypothetical protein